MVVAVAVGMAVITDASAVVEVWVAGGMVVVVAASIPCTAGWRPTADQVTSTGETLSRFSTPRRYRVIGSASSLGDGDGAEAAAVSDGDSCV